MVGLQAAAVLALLQARDAGVDLAHDRGFVECQQAPAAHQYPAVDDRRIDIAGARGVDQRGGEIMHRLDMRAVDSHLGIRSHLDCASTDANIPLSMGIPALSIGAGGHGGGAHTPQEWFLPDGRDLALKRILLTLALLLRDPGTC